MASDTRDFWLDADTLEPVDWYDVKAESLVVVRASSLEEALELLNDEQRA